MKIIGETTDEGKTNFCSKKIMALCLADLEFLCFVECASRWEAPYNRFKFLCWSAV